MSTNYSTPYVFVVLKRKLKFEVIMRVIKFRGKDIDSGEWVYGDLHTLCDRPHIHTNPSPYPYAGKRSFIDPETIGQFTGLLDKNGREIYEGDILEVCEMYAKVVWNEEKASFEYQYLHPMQLTNTFYEFNMPYLSIIGNIHDNPELIKSKEINL